MLEIIRLCEKKTELRFILKKCVHKSYILNIYTYKKDLALNNQQWLISHKTQPNQIIYI